MVQQAASFSSFSSTYIQKKMLQLKGYSNKIQGIPTYPNRKSIHTNNLVLCIDTYNCLFIKNIHHS